MQNGKNHLSSLIACKQTLFIILKILESSTVFYAFTLQSQKVYAFMDLLIDQVARSTRLWGTGGNGLVIRLPIAK